MSKEDATRFVCSECGHVSTKWLGKCPECGSWNSFSEEKVSASKTSSKAQNVSSVTLSSVPYEKDFRFESGISELDRVLGGGIVRASAVLVGGEPGIGKSTLMLQLGSNCSARRSVLYISGEESGSQVRQRAERLGLETGGINILCETKLANIVHVIETEKPQVLIVDSLQTLCSEEVSSIPGSVSQLRTCCMEITTICKAVGTSVFLIGHVTKEGTIAGPKIIEHMVDTVLYFEESSSDGVRMIRAVKNRFGSVDELGIFLMGPKGLEGVKDPASFFISERKDSILPPGIAYTAVSEGTRTFMVEIQALVTDAKSGYTHVYSDKIDSSRVQRVAAILERHANIRLSDKDIYVNVAGGMKVNDVSAELALAMALFSAGCNVKLPEKTVCFGELSLAGEVRPVSYAEKRLKAASEMGFVKAIVPSSVKDDSKLNLVRISKVSDIINR